MAIDPTLKSVMETLEDVGKRLESLNETPNTTTAAVAPVATATSTITPPQKRFLTQHDQFELRQQLSQKSVPELLNMFSIQARKSESGIPFEVWASGNRSISAAIETEGGMLTKALDTSGATALIRQDLEPLLYALYIKTFPAWERFPKEPANGLVHAFNRTTSFGDAQFMTELGTVTDDVSVYERDTTPVSVIATRRGISLKSQFAVVQGGGGWNPEQLELQGGLLAIAHKMQKTIFQGNAAATGGTASTEDGLYDANAFTGLRRILNTARAKNVDPYATTPEQIRVAMDRASEEIMQAGGNSVSAVYIRPTDKVTLDLQQDDKTRWVTPALTGPVGVSVSAVNTLFGALPMTIIPGDSIGTYNITGPQEVGDIYLLDESSMSLPYLGSDGPTVLDIPIGISGQLTHLYIIFGMWGLAVKVPQFSNKVRVYQS